MKKICSGALFQGHTAAMRSWSDLPDGILSMIIGHLCLVGQIRFRTVCKDWRLTHSDRSFPKLPWLMTHEWAWSETGNPVSINKFYFPSVKYPYVSKHELDWEDCVDIFGASICASQHGWLLLQKDEKSFVYNPFSRVLLKLPDIEGITFNRATFSSAPTSTDCVFFAIQSSKEGCEIKISSCSLGDPGWTTEKFPGLSRAIEDVVYSKGILYCLFRGGVLGSYHVGSNKWSVLTGMGPITGVDFRQRSQIAVSDIGELLLVCFSRTLHVYGFNRLENAWVSRNCLENLVLFLGCTLIAVSECKEARELADRIYYHRKTRTCFHRLSTGTSHQCSEIYPCNNEGEMEAVWIESPQF